MRVYLSCHHKTGTHFLRSLVNVLRKYDKNNTYIRDIHSHKAYNDFKHNDKIIHITRHPYEVIVSGYNYHKITTEGWCIDPKKKTSANNKQYSFNGLSYQEKLNTLDMESGIDFEMVGRSYDVIMDMYNFKHKNNPNCLNMKMEDLFTNDIKFIQTIIKFLNIKQLKIKNILDHESLYLNTNEKSNLHSTNKSMDPMKHKTIFSEKNYETFLKIFPKDTFLKLNYNDKESN